MAGSADVIAPAPESKTETRRIPSPDAQLRLEKRWVEITALLNVAYGDFEQARLAQIDFGDTPYDRRCIVRCFGSFVDGLAVAMREYAFTLLVTFGEPTNQFLHDKCDDRGNTSHRRVYTSYRFIAGFLPGSPFARVPDSRWDRLHRALEIRNRVLHPTSAANLDVSDKEIELTLKLGAEFVQDYRQFLEWFDQKQQRIIQSLPGQQRRHTKPKLGRNVTCRCGSGRKYKNCCAAALLVR